MPRAMKRTVSGCDMGRFRLQNGLFHGMIRALSQPNIGFNITWIGENHVFVMFYPPSRFLFHAVCGIIIFVVTLPLQSALYKPCV